ncbi:MAG: DUF1015 domain-containing protein [Gammaproteobacteria bacterium]|nr:DUF1015 domain-containing protein [Gammaproteobacteria bacterium]NIR82103.1 DUF1015 domain-containing protein [Gammaproteobacteria bacterium]NIR89336.1 DUF1015 domain-containing protein [Gammaproteobacteria bacterium]NIU03213.1 DUF1015 domain-containing protein [Gammaproteobacteria bacterium]NIV74508.1 DUF1015 family protein [Gammaproteobacteria bacterium]
MPTVKAFDAYIANPERASEIAAPAYDALTPRERHRFAEAHPTNYLNVIRSVEEFPPEERPAFEELLRANVQRLHEMLETGLLLYNPQPGYYVYRLAIDAHVQVGVVAEVPVQSYEQGLVKRHENTQTEKEEQLARYLKAVRAGSSPVCLAYPHQPDIDALVSQAMRAKPLIDFVADDGLAQTVWFVDDDRMVRELTERLSAVPAFYLTDGHHRAAAASRYAARRRAGNPQHTGHEAYNYLLAALFPDNQLRILDYNRCVRGLNGHSARDLLAALERPFVVEALDVAAPEQARPRRRHEMAMHLDGCWYRLTARPEILPRYDPVHSLDLMLLQEHVLEPTLGIVDPRSDTRIDYVPGPFGLDGLEGRCRDGWDLAFAVYPTSIRELMEVADTHQTMPPKSTWFDPKVRSGLFVRLR